MTFDPAKTEGGQAHFKYSRFWLAPLVSLRFDSGWDVGTSPKSVVYAWMWNGTLLEGFQAGTINVSEMVEFWEPRAAQPPPETLENLIRAGPFQGSQYFDLVAAYCGLQQIRRLANYQGPVRLIGDERTVIGFMQGENPMSLQIGNFNVAERVRHRIRQIEAQFTKVSWQWVPSRPDSPISKLQQYIIRQRHGTTTAQEEKDFHAKMDVLLPTGAWLT